MWADFDPDADQKIPGSDLPELVSRIPPPMGVAGQDKRKALRFCMTLKLMQEPNGDVGFQVRPLCLMAILYYAYYGVGIQVRSLCLM